MLQSQGFTIRPFTRREATQCRLPKTSRCSRATPIPQLAQDICSYLGIQLGNIDVFKFKNDNTFVKILENVRERDVFIVQPLQ